MDIDAQIDEVNVKPGMIFGCLEIIDDGEEYIQRISERIVDKNVEKEEYEIYVLRAGKNINHYKCKCRKCGKIRYYSYETLQKEPKVCYRPISRNMGKNENDESVRLVNDMNEVMPSEKYCDAWNKKRMNELSRQQEKEAMIIATLPRKLAINYDVDYVGTVYESLEIVECVSSKLEVIPVVYGKQHKKTYSNIVVCKQYYCKCYLCGKEQFVMCDQFGINPPRGYLGYYSSVFCDCHGEISSFQWIVNDILIKHGIDYRVEVQVDDLYGVDNRTPLRFDFAVYRKKELVAYIECQGEQHYKPVEEFGGECRLAIQQTNDEKKRKYAQDQNIKLIEISYKDKKYEKVEAILRKEHIIPNE